MLEIILNILAVIGVILLALLAFLLIVILLVLFFPVSYRIYGKNEEGLTAAAKARWLFGLVRVSYSYPEPGRVRIKVLMFTVYDSKIPAEKMPEGEAVEKEKHKKNKRKDRSASKGEEISGGAAKSEREEKSERGERSGGSERSGETKANVKERVTDGEGINPAQSGKAEEAEQSGGVISQKIEKIQYTIRSIYDKIKGIWENISYYIELLQEEDTKLLVSYTMGKLAVILKHLRPRHVKADVLFGTGSPDTTGYAYGAYCMLSGAWGNGIVVTPDFEQQIFQARFDARGRITAWVLTINVLKVVLDKRLQGFITKMKAGKKSSSSK